MFGRERKINPQQIEEEETPEALVSTPPVAETETVPGTFEVTSEEETQTPANPDCEIIVIDDSVAEEEVEYGVVSSRLEDSEKYQELEAAIRRYQAAQRRGMRPETAFIESGLHAAIKDY